MKDLFAKIRAGHRRSLAKAITLVESSLDAHRADAEHLINLCLPYTGNSVRIGISGSPGVGKSTFIEAFGEVLLHQANKKLAVLAVDPSSGLAGGSILGDKTRMEHLSREENVFIRPSPSSGALGGVAQKTRETVLLCEAAGFDLILLETVGVGQLEYDVAGMVDYFILLLQPYSGDELQGIKKGILEMADALVINKADGEGRAFAELTQSHVKNALGYLSKHEAAPDVLICSAREKTQIDTVWEAAVNNINAQKQSGRFITKRAEQNKLWMDKLFLEMLQHKLRGNKHMNLQRQKIEQDVLEGNITPIRAAAQLADILFKQLSDSTQ